MYLVKIAPDSDSRYVSQIYAGLYELAAAGVIRLKFAKTHLGKSRKNKNSIFNLLMEVTDSQSGKCCNIYFDMIDGSHTLLMDDLNNADIYFKRTYDERYIGTLKKELRRKILPYGLHYTCRSRHETPTMLMRRLLLINFNNKSFLSAPTMALKQTLGRPLKSFMMQYLFKRLIPGQPLLIKSYEAQPTDPVRKKIYFKTRVYDVNAARSENSFEQMAKVNETRVGTLRALKSHFGKDLVGGLLHSSFATKNYPDCISFINNSHAQHIENGKQYLIHINTDGLHGSVGWKLPEQIAASRCIVSEPVTIKLPVPIEEGKHYLPFKNPNECIQACEQLMNDINLSTSMRHNNCAYYKEHIEPSKLIHRCLKSAFINLSNMQY